MADPECRQVAERAYKVLFQVGGEGQVKPLAKADSAKLCDTLTSIAKANGATKVRRACRRACLPLGACILGAAARRSRRRPRP